MTDHATPEQPAVTGEPDEELIRKPQTPTTGINAFAGKWKPDVSDKEFFERTQGNDGIPQTASRASRPAVELLGAIGDEYWDARSDDDLMSDVHEALGCGQMPHDMSLAVLYSRLSAARQRITELSTRDPVSRTLGATDSAK